MLIDWFTIGAQIVNFLILLLLLKRFLYKPIINAMNEREQKITFRLREAERMQEEADREAQDYRERIAELENKRDEFLHEAKNEAETWRKEMLQQARQEVEEAQSRWYRALHEEKEAFLRELYQRASSQTYALARRALADLANKDLETHIIETFISRIRSLEEEEREALEIAMNSGDGEVVVRSAFEIPGHLRQEIEQEIDSLTANGNELRFEMLPDILCGIELKLAGQKIAWSLASYLESLEESLSDALRESVEDFAQAEAQPASGSPEIE